jgi:acetone carboxylase gamma subunit
MVTKRDSSLSLNIKYKRTDDVFFCGSFCQKVIRCQTNSNFLRRHSWKQEKSSNDAILNFEASLKKIYSMYTTRHFENVF